MADKQKQYQQVPATALRCEATLEPIDQSKLHDDGDGVTRAPVQILARTGDAIETPYWGRIVHDLAGMTKRHNRVMVDYSHDGEPIGFCEETTVSERGLEMFAELVSTSPNDRAATVLKKAAAGIEYEAAIDWNGPGTTLEQLEEGEETEVNGRTFAGPGYVVRSWPLRSVAITPFGADPDTHAQFVDTEPHQIVTVFRKAELMPELANLHAEPQPQPEPQPEPQPAAAQPPEQPVAEPALAQHSEPVAEPQPAAPAAPQAANIADLKALCDGAPEGFDKNGFIVDAGARGLDIASAAIAYTTHLEQFAAAALGNASAAEAKVAAFDRGEEHPVSFQGASTQEATKFEHPLQQFISIAGRRGQLN